MVKRLQKIFTKKKMTFRKTLALFVLFSAVIFCIQYFDEAFSEKRSGPSIVSFLLQPNRDENSNLNDEWVSLSNFDRIGNHGSKSFDAQRKSSATKFKHARFQKLFDLDGPQSTDAPYKDCYQDGTTDAGRPRSRKSNLAAMIRAAYPKD